ncbi:3-isopropylmalate dehydratase small subunit [Petroclostridium sp. X23]|uniref:3-isopropylmalate dehydratase small subunit n=1 Tax=Petroclostridium sp. X23 TaxID=3045146 RepID=UPI0024ADDF69|nr:3-isopropylmalate dehydratase small subunit [Petroclostridium sp. X23]WHH61134.1 3-isopropylmalate dehydratase small subunit [Petroclostridium sp. X23]
MGTAHKFGNNIDTDLIVPGKYLSLSDAKDLGNICMEGADPEFVNKVKRGDVIVAGTNFGCGSSREHAPISILASGVNCVIAESFARIFYRNAINLGLLVLESAEAAKAISDGDEIEVAVIEGVIENKTTGKKYFFVPFPPSIMEIVKAGGIKKKLISDLNIEKN